MNENVDEFITATFAKFRSEMGMLEKWLPIMVRK